MNVIELHPQGAPERLSKREMQEKLASPIDRDEIDVEACVRLLLKTIKEGIDNADMEFLSSDTCKKYLNLIPNKDLGKFLNMDDNTMTPEEICVILCKRALKRRKR